MRIEITIAIRNLQRHKGRSLVICVILFLGAFIMTIGSGFISGMKNGMEENITNSFTGDAVVVSDKQNAKNVFFDLMGKPVEPIFNAKAIDSVLGNLPCVAKFLPIGKNIVTIINEDGGAPGTIFVLGVDFKKYFAMFPNSAYALEGNIPTDLRAGVVLLTEGARKMIYGYMNTWYMPEGESLCTKNMPPEVKIKKHLRTRDNIVLMGMNSDNTATDMRLPVAGIINYRALNGFWGFFILTDTESYRTCMGYFRASDRLEKLEPDLEKIFSKDDLEMDKMFQTEMVIDALEMKKERKMKVGMPAEGAAASSQSREKVDSLSGVYNLVLTKFTPGVTQKEGLKKLNAALSKANLGVHALSWQDAVGQVGTMALIIKSGLFIFGLIVFLVAAIMVINTLSIGIIERTSEIAMMRAIGANRGFVSNLVVSETVLLSALFGGMGMVVGIVAVVVLSLLNVTSTNDIVQIVFGGQRLSPTLSITDLLVILAQLAIVSALALFYPVYLVNKIKPIEAIEN
jgi:ABC-type lipoprotein release transport system permease subunit